MEQSWQSRAVIELLRLAGRRRHFQSAAGIQKRLTRPRPPAPPPKSLNSSLISHDWTVHRIRPAAPAPAQATVLYLHGGAYIGEIVRPHWNLIAQLTEAPAEVIVPLYPLAPYGRAASVVAATAELITATAPTVLMGDSAGGGLALAAALRLRDQGADLPSRVVLISPWLDVTMTAPLQDAIEPVDPMLARPGLAEAGRLWAADLDVRHPDVSPLHGSFEGLPPTTVHCGTRDLLLTDSRTFTKAATKAGVQVDYHEAPGQPHVYPLMPTPEGRAARRSIIEACR
ncbi:alpha/beta hydrolase [Spirillospora sp. NPDC047279]|uniref:alpha/beta hydrolase n=1 Tax=Spirillospora sp. NPDC047279 TaxID=3155478 RepID=UPI0033C0E0D5